MLMPCGHKCRLKRGCPSGWVTNYCRQLASGFTDTTACAQAAFADCAEAMTLDEEFMDAIAMRANIRRMVGDYEVRTLVSSS